jgi:proteic killer suppression protein
MGDWWDFVKEGGDARRLTNDVSRQYKAWMILSFRDKRTEAFARGTFVREFQGFDRQAFKRLEILDAATSVADLRSLPSNRLEALKGDRAGQFSIRINMQWRICFEWPEGRIGPSLVEIVDYH